MIPDHERMGPNNLRPVRTRGRRFAQGTRTPGRFHKLRRKKDLHHSSSGGFALLPDALKLLAALVGLMAALVGLCTAMVLLARALAAG